MFNIRRLPLVNQTLVGVIAICLVIAIPLSIALYHYTRVVAQDAAGGSLKTQLDLISLTLDYAQESMKREALDALERFESNLPDARLGGGTMSVGGMPLPELMFGDIRGIGNQSYLLAYKEKNPSNDVAFLIASGGNLYRGTTLLKDTKGGYRDGSQVSDDYAKTVLDGKLYLGTIQRSGKPYALAVRPIKDAGGRVIGAISMRVSIDESDSTLKKRLGELVLGTTGYPFIISMPIGDQKEANFVLHPVFRGQPVSAVADAHQAHFQQIVEQKTGSMIYDWPKAGGKGTEKMIAIFREIADLHWIVVATAPMEEYTATYDALVRFSLIGLLCMILALVLCLWGVVRYQLSPIGGLARVLAQMGKGDLSQTLATLPESQNEIDVLAGNINDASEEMKMLVGAIRVSSTTVTTAATAVSGNMGNLSGSIDELSSISSQVSHSISGLSASIEQIAQAAKTTSGRVDETAGKVAHGKKVVHGVIDSIQTIGDRVQSTLSEVEHLTEHSHKIETVVASIGAIAKQTNLLALNAAIEAARAGEVGRGFAVVADEVRKLAEQSSSSADEIGKILNEIMVGIDTVRVSIDSVVQETSNGTRASGDAGQALDGIEEITRALVDNVNIIARSTTEQASAAQSMTDQVNSVAQIADDTGKVAHDASQTSAELKVEADKLIDEVGHFRI